jgi:hypothetical protein
MIVRVPVLAIIIMIQYQLLILIIILTPVLLLVLVPSPIIIVNHLATRIVHHHPPPTLTINRHLLVTKNLLLITPLATKLNPITTAKKTVSALALKFMPGLAKHRYNIHPTSVQQDQKCTEL